MYRPRRILANSGDPTYTGLFGSAKHTPKSAPSMSTSEDLFRIALQEQRLVFLAFEEEAAWRLGLRLRALASERALALVIDIRRPAQPLFYAALPGTTP